MTNLKHISITIFLLLPTNQLSFAQHTPGLLCRALPPACCQHMLWHNVHVAHASHQESLTQHAYLISVWGRTQDKLRCPLNPPTRSMFLIKTYNTYITNSFPWILKVIILCYKRWVKVKCGENFGCRDYFFVVVGYLSYATSEGIPMWEWLLFYFPASHEIFILTKKMADSSSYTSYCWVMDVFPSK